MLKNKKADIAITILVIAVVVLCIATLFSFYFWGGKIGRTVNSAYFLQDAYNLAESINYSVKNSGIGMIDKYDGQNGYSVKPEGQEVVIKRTYYKKDLGVTGLGVDINEEVLKITYSFNP
ncbi:MAG: hypothetical protein Q8N63_04460 [Nanoarchaeota archaeon]|nr:hypothetical protein [Nanoarchaeota archaeon]